MDLKRGWTQRPEEGCFQEEGQREEKGLLSKLRLQKEEFLDVIKKGKYQRSGGFTLYLLKDKKRGFGISISKKIKGAVLRNKIKRRIKEIYWKNMEKIPENSRMVIIVRENLIVMPYKSLKGLFLSLLNNLTAENAKDAEKKIEQESFNFKKLYVLSMFCGEQLLLFLIRVYQITISPFLGRNCRFKPSCSEYAKCAIKKYKARGIFLCLKRLLSCHPFNKGGYVPLN